METACGTGSIPVGCIDFMTKVLPFTQERKRSRDRLQHTGFRLRFNVNFDGTEERLRILDGLIRMFEETDYVVKMAYPALDDLGQEDYDRVALFTRRKYSEFRSY